LASGVLQQALRFGSVTSNDLADGAVITPTIADGAVTMPKLSSAAVGSDQLAPDAVRTDKLAPASVTPEKLAPAELWHFVGAPGEPQFADDAQNSGDLGVPGGGLDGAAFYKDQLGIVHLSGVINPPSDKFQGDVTVFQLPPGYRPLSDCVFLVAGGYQYGNHSVAWVQVSPSGLVDAGPTDLNAFGDRMPIWLNTVTFRVSTGSS
jgi:hypothetical protein